MRDDSLMVEEPKKKFIRKVVIENERIFAVHACKFICVYMYSTCESMLFYRQLLAERQYSSSLAIW